LAGLGTKITEEDSYFFTKQSLWHKKEKLFNKSFFFMNSFLERKDFLMFQNLDSCSLNRWRDC
jgi:hypothetical protein